MFLYPLNLCQLFSIWLTYTTHNHWFYFSLLLFELVQIFLDRTLFYPLWENDEDIAVDYGSKSKFSAQMRRFELLIAIRRIGFLLIYLVIDSRPTHYYGPNNSALGWPLCHICTKTNYYCPLLYFNTLYIHLRLGSITVSTPYAMVNCTK